MTDLIIKKMFLLSPENLKKVDGKVRKKKVKDKKYNGSHYINSLIERDKNDK